MGGFKPAISTQAVQFYSGAVGHMTSGGNPLIAVSAT